MSCAKDLHGQFPSCPCVVKKTVSGKTTNDYRSIVTVHLTTHTDILSELAGLRC